ncbi:DMT family transporter [Aliarcobacter lanthieri]|uniref:DMT family transporter n=1 Tax=Aliarcobacter lanthieri TaxID=1355374 RepID=UPI003AB06F11
MQKNTNAHLLILFATFLSGGSFIITQKLTGGISPYSITLLRFTISFLILLPFVFMKKEYRKNLLSTFKRAMIISFFYAAFFIGMFIALEYTTALNTGTIFTFVPLITAIFSIFAFGQKIALRKYFIYFIGIIGTSLVVFKGDIDMFFSLSLNKGDIIFFISIIFIALYSISAKYFYRKDDNILVLVFMTLVGGSIWMAMAIFILNIPLEWDKIDGKQFLYIGYLSIAATLITAYLYQKTNIVLGPKKVMAYTYLTPATIALLSFIFEFKLINIWMFIGILISSLITIVLLKGE